MLFDIPDTFAATTLESADENVIVVALRVIAGDQVEQAGFTAAVGTGKLPVLPGLDAPIKYFEDQVVCIADTGVAYTDQGVISVQFG